MKRKHNLIYILFGQNNIPLTFLTNLKNEITKKCCKMSVK